ncbi:glycosyltransferase [Halopiger xanaduensis]|uniref:Glycosyl transferase group 1 n=1 Tax=Halopiger xanaduensis (strain DSM 18323 / JCM 14033 / SH-6) TaxID=797210 RepID=F8DA31_HALXS|nr:glycosyltransferase [Halopiger xanaduensis]AEH36949.1 glycosyl transferase group 1 [Halopiger xanaduensis SH-6]
MSSKVTLFIGDLSIGGAERVTVNLANQLSENGHQVEVLVISQQGKLINELSPDVRLSVLPVNRMLWSIIPLAKHLRQSQSDVIIPMMAGPNILTILSRKISLTSPQVIVTEHINRTNNYHNELHDIFPKYLYKYADNVVGVSEGVTEHIKDWAKIDPDKVTTIYNPVVNEGITKISPQTPSEFKRNSKTILGVGRHTPQKDFKTLIRSFAILSKEYSEDVQLIILGKGECTSEYKSLAGRLNIREDVYFPGFVDDPFQYMSNADVFCLSSRLEGLANVLIEAMACGTPVVSTDCPSGPAEVLKNGKYGKLVPIEDPEAMKSALITTLENPISAEKLKKRAQDFSIEESTKKYEALFED